MVWCNLHEKEQKADFPVVQWLRFHTLNAGGIDVIPSWEAGMLYEEVCDQKKKEQKGRDASAYVIHTQRNVLPKWR